MPDQLRPHTRPVGCFQLLPRCGHLGAPWGLCQGLRGMQRLGGSSTVPLCPGGATPGTPKPTTMQTLGNGEMALQKGWGEGLPKGPGPSRD